MSHIEHQKHSSWQQVISIIPNVADFLKPHLLEDVSVVRIQIGLLHTNGLRAIASQVGGQLVQPIAIGRPQEVLCLKVLQVQSIGNILPILICEVGGGRCTSNQQH
jgi:hypothetical protein